MNKTNLKFELDLDFVLVAITTQLKDYMFCFKTNKQLGTDFSKIADLELPFNTDEDPFYFSRYFFLLPESETELYILANKGTEGFLVPEMKKVDFFLKIENPEVATDQIIKKINSIKSLSAAYSVETNLIKSKNNLIF